MIGVYLEEGRDGMPGQHILIVQFVVVSLMELIGVRNGCRFKNS